MISIFEALIQTAESIKTWAENKFLNKDEVTADNFGVYVQDIEPTNAVAGDIWIDTANDATYIEPTLVETDPTVPSWAKESTKPSYTKSEVGLGNVDNVKQYSVNNPPPYPVTSVNGKSGAVVIKTSDLTNDSGFISGYTETDPTVPSWAKAASKPSYTKSEVGLGNVDNVQQYSASNPPPYPVTSVNGKTGAVTIGTLPNVTTSDNGKVLMVVNGAWAVVDINLSIDANGVVSV